MLPTSETTCIAFAEDAGRIASGSLRDVARAVKEALDRDGSARVLVFDAASSYPIELDLRGSVEDVIDRLPAPAETSAGEEDAAPEKRGPGRPKLGVVAREVTLLPRHWDWLASQPGGASVTLRKLVEAARKDNARADEIRVARESTYRFASAMAGNEPGFEEAMRALFAGDRERFEAETATWPPDVRAHALDLAAASFGTIPGAPSAG